MHTSRELGVGLVSAGWMGKLHSQAYQRVNYHYPELGVRPRPVIAADVLPEQRELATTQLGYPHTTDDWREVIAHPDVAAVSITAPNYLHREIAVAAAEHGKHFWIEKPVGTGLADAEAIADAVRRAGVRTAVGFNYRHAPAVAHARELITSGQLGRISHVRGFFLNDYAAEPRGALSWRFRRERAGSGVLGDLMAHTVDLLQHLLGPVAEVSALTSTMITERPLPPEGAGTHFSVVDGGKLAPVENEDYASALLRFDDGAGFGAGAVGTAEASRVTVGPRCQIGFDVHGADGAVSWDFERMNELRVCLGRAGANHGYTTVRTAPGHGEFARFQPGPAIGMGYDDLKVVEAALFLRSILGEDVLVPDVPDAHRVTRVLAAMEHSARARSWQPVGAD